MQRIITCPLVFPETHFANFQVVASNGGQSTGIMITQTRFARRCTVLLGALLLLLLTWLLFYHECASGGAMGGWYRTCTCRGIERLDFDSTAADGPLRTVCYGWVSARNCYRSRGGPEMPCDEMRR